MFALSRIPRSHKTGLPFQFPPLRTSVLASSVTFQPNNLSDPVSRNEPADKPTAEPPSIDTNILPPQHWEQLTEQLNAQGDADSTFSENASSTESVTSSILHYRTINGRTYQSERGNADYWGPVDGTHQEAMDINHQVLTLLAGGKLFLAPLPDNVQKIVDIGTGTGIWAIDFADAFPGASVIGTDLAPIQPSWVPSNAQFQIDDCTKEWTFEDNSQDYIHTRWLAGSIQDLPALFKQAYRCLKPGGYLESFEPSSRLVSDDGTVTETSALSQWGKFFVEGGRKIGRSFTVLEDRLQRKVMEEAGFVDIVEKDFKNPVGQWPKDRTLREIGMYRQLALEQDAEVSVLFMATTLGWSREEVAVFLSHFRREVRNKNIHSYFWQRAVWGRKPTSS